jgi:hypothetical protein
MSLQVQELLIRSSVVKGPLLSILGWDIDESWNITICPISIPSIFIYLKAVEPKWRTKQRQNKISSCMWPSFRGDSSKQGYRTSLRQEASLYLKVVVYALGQWRESVKHNCMLYFPGSRAAITENNLGSHKALHFGVGCLTVWSVYGMNTWQEIGEQRVMYSSSLVIQIEEIVTVLISSSFSFLGKNKDYHTCSAICPIFLWGSSIILMQSVFNI